MSWKWLMEKIRGYAALPGPDRDAITTFALLWSLFKAKLMGSQATARKIASAIDQWDAAGGIAAELYDGEVAYFRDLYLESGEFTFRFDKLQLRKWDNARSYRGLYKGDADTPRARVLTVLLIIWRFRNTSSMARSGHMTCKGNSKIQPRQRGSDACFGTAHRARMSLTRVAGCRR